MHVGAVHGDDVLVAHARQHAAFLHHRFGIRARRETA